MTIFENKTIAKRQANMLERRRTNADASSRGISRRLASINAPHCAVDVLPSESNHGESETRSHHNDETYFKQTDGLRCLPSTSNQATRHALFQVPWSSDHNSSTRDDRLSRVISARVSENCNVISAPLMIKSLRNGRLNTVISSR